MDNHDNRAKKRSSSKILRNNAAKNTEKKSKKSVGTSISVAHVVQENQSDQEEDDNLVNNLTGEDVDIDNNNNKMQVGVVYKKPHFSQKEKDIHPSGWYNINNLQEGENAYNRFEKFSLALSS
eukprot:11073187-Ditylum_brightwellii.AAC.1